MGPEAPQAPICESILALLDEREVYDPVDDGRPPRFAKGLQFVVAAAVLARTPDVPVPAATQSGEAGPSTNISKPASG